VTTPPSRKSKREVIRAVAERRLEAEEVGSEVDNVGGLEVEEGEEGTVSIPNAAWW